MTKTDEQRFVVLLSIYDLWGEANKDRVLNNIEHRGYYRLDDRDKEWMESRNELRWRNSLAFARKRLEQEKCISGWQRDNWEMTEKGVATLRRLADDVNSDFGFQKLSSAALSRAKEIR